MTKRQHDFRQNILDPALERMAPGTIFTLRSLIMKYCHRHSILLRHCAWYGAELVRIAECCPEAGFVEISSERGVFKKL